MKRRIYYIDRRVQGALVLRSVMYWVVCLAAVTLGLLVWRAFTGPARVFHTHFDDLWFQYGPVFIASLLVLPLIIVDTIRLSNRFAGPVFRLRRLMHELAQGERVEAIKFREGDFWQDMAIDFNAIAARIDRLQREVTTLRDAEPVGAGNTA